jgi:hypothetical protein
LRNKLLSWSKNVFQKNEMEFWKVLPHSKLLTYFKHFENLAPISKCFVKRCFKPFCLCFWKSWEKRPPPNGVFQKWIYENLFSKPLKNAIKRFWFTKSKTNFKKGICFQMKTISSCYPILQKWISFQKENCFQSCLLIQKLLFKAK